jgi:hypothetical protein
MKSLPVEVTHSAIRRSALGQNESWHGRAVPATRGSSAARDATRNYENI